MPDGLFDRGKIVAYLDEVAAILEEKGGPSGVLIVVGGSYLALQDLRESTVDVDTIRRIEEPVRKAVEKVAERHGLAPDWLNDKAAPYAPRGLTLADCDVLHDHPQLRVYGPPPKYVFVMKLYAGRAPDYDDMVALWPLCGFAAAADAVAQFDAAYPHAADDPYLLEYVEEIAAEARRRQGSG